MSTPRRRPSLLVSSLQRLIGSGGAGAETRTAAADAAEGGGSGATPTSRRRRAKSVASLTPRPDHEKETRAVDRRHSLDEAAFLAAMQNLEALRNLPPTPVHTPRDGAGEKMSAEV